MMGIPPQERDGLVHLLRELSPQSLEVHAPPLPAALRPLETKRLPCLPRALLFDVYGTLLASAAGSEPLAPGRGGEGGKAAALLAMELPALGWRSGPASFADVVDEAVRQANAARRPACPFPEVDIEGILGGILPGRPPATLRRLAILLECSRNPCAPMPGAGRLLEKLGSLGLALGLVSNAQFYTPLLLEALLGEALGSRHVERELCAFSFELGIAKPDPEPFRRCAASLAARGLAPGEILVIGNSAGNDIAPARALGMMTALAACDGRSLRPPAGDDPAAMPDTVIARLGSLATLVTGGRPGPTD